VLIVQATSAAETGRIDGPWGWLQLRDLLMGPGTEIIVEGFQPFDTETRSPGEAAFEQADGGYAGREYRESKRVPIRLHVDHDPNTAEAVAVHRQILAAFAPSHVDIPLTFWWAGRLYRMYGRPRSVQHDQDLFDIGAYRLQANFLATDPLVYSDDEVVTTLGLPSDSGGLTLPATLPTSIDASLTTGTATVFNDGTANAPWRAVIHGPVTDPRLGNLTTGQELALNLTIPEGRYVDLDFKTRSVLLDGNAPRRGAVSGTWWDLAPGANEVVFNAAAYDTDASAQLIHRHAWS
jgi:hypothetical protein